MGEKENAVGSRSAYYKGYRIESCPSQHSETDAWSARIFISWEPFGPDATRSFSSDEFFQTREAASLRGFTLGELMIDGIIPGLIKD